MTEPTFKAAVIGICAICATTLLIAGKGGWGWMIAIAFGVLL